MAEEADRDTLGVPLQHPILTALDGAKSLSREDLDTQERQACAAMAAGTTQALMCLHELHPRRADYLRMLADYQRAAGPHHVRALDRVG